MIQQLQEQLGAAKARTRPIPEQTRIPIPTLPKLGPDTPLETFLTTFDAPLRGSGVPEDLWKYRLIGQIDDKHRTLLTDCMADDTFTYANLVERLDKLEGGGGGGRGRCLCRQQKDTLPQKLMGVE